MKRKFKSSVLLIAVGIALMLIAYAVSGFRLENLEKKEEMEKKTLRFEEKVTNIEIDEAFDNIHFVKSDDDSTTITYEESQSHQYSATLTDGILRYTHKSNVFRWFNLFRHNMPDLTLTIPDGVSITLKGGDGNVYIEGFQIANFQTELDNGSLYIEDTKLSGNLFYRNRNGFIQAENMDIAGKVHMESTNGKMNLRNITAGNVEAELTNGGISMSQVHSKRDITLTSTNGKLLLQDLDFAHSLRMETTNGRVEASIRGKETDYSVHAQTNNGKKNITSADRNTDKSIYVQTTNGGIHISFTGE